MNNRVSRALRNGRKQPEKRVRVAHEVILRTIKDLSQEEHAGVKVILYRRAVQRYINDEYGGDLTPTQEELDARKARQLLAQQGRRQPGESKTAHQKRLKKQRRERRQLGKAAIRKEQVKNRLNDILSKLRKCPEDVCCVDLEMWERHQKKLTEIGITVFNRRTRKIKTVHFIIEENYKKRNGKFVDDNKDNFLHGDSEILPQEEALARTQEILNQYQVVIGHSVAGDLRYLRKLGIETKHLRVIDTLNLFKAYQEVNQPRALGKVCAKYGLNHIAPHNAANDSHINMYLFALLAKRMESKYPEFKQVKEAA